MFRQTHLSFGKHCHQYFAKIMDILQLEYIKVFNQITCLKIFQWCLGMASKHCMPNLAQLCDLSKVATYHRISLIWLDAIKTNENDIAEAHKLSAN